MFNHGIITTALFLLVGFLAARTGTTYVTSLRGLQGPAPVLAALFTVAMLASIGLPGLNGFVSEFLVLLGFFGAHGWWAILPTLGVVVAAIYLLWAYQQVFQGAHDPAHRGDLGPRLRERAVLAPLLAIMVLLGVYPKLVLDRIRPSVVHLLVHTCTPPPASSDWTPMIAAPSIHYVVVLPEFIFAGCALALLIATSLVRGRLARGGRHVRRRRGVRSRCSSTASSSGSTSRATARRRPIAHAIIEDGFGDRGDRRHRDLARAVDPRLRRLARARARRGRRAAHPRALLGHRGRPHGPGERPRRDLPRASRSSRSGSTCSPRSTAARRARARRRSSTSSSAGSPRRSSSTASRSSTGRPARPSSARSRRSSRTTCSKSEGLLLAGTALVLVGFAFKVAAVPFHVWSPDVYEGSPTPIAGYMAAVVKVGAFAAVLRVLASALFTQQAAWRPMVWALRRAHDARRRRARRGPAQHEAAARLLLDQPRRLRAHGAVGGVGRRHRRGAVLPRASTRCSRSARSPSCHVVSADGKRGPRRLPRARPRRIRGSPRRSRSCSSPRRACPFTTGFLAKLAVLEAAIGAARRRRRRPRRGRDARDGDRRLLLPARRRPHLRRPDRCASDAPAPPRSTSGTARARRRTARARRARALRRSQGGRGHPRRRRPRRPVRGAPRDHRAPGGHRRRRHRGAELGAGGRRGRARAPTARRPGAGRDRRGDRDVRRARPSCSGSGRVRSPR